MNKRLKTTIAEIIEENNKLRFSLGAMALMFFSIVLLIVAAFSQIPMINLSVPPEYLFNPMNSAFPADSINWTDYKYIPQVPVIFFIASLLGKSFGLVTILIYIILGLTPWFPIFALGGGIGYILQYSFGYILGYLPAVYFTGNSFKQDFSFVNILKSTFVGVLMIHLAGTLYLSVLAFFKHDSLDFILDLIMVQSVGKIFYDYIFSVIIVVLVKYAKRFLWLING